MSGTTVGTFVADFSFHFQTEIFSLRKRRFWTDEIVPMRNERNTSEWNKTKETETPYVQSRFPVRCMQLWASMTHILWAEGSKGAALSWGCVSAHVGATLSPELPAAHAPRGLRSRSCGRVSRTGGVCVRLMKCGCHRGEPGPLRTRPLPAEIQGFAAPQLHLLTVPGNCRRLSGALSASQGLWLILLISFSFWLQC